MDSAAHEAAVERVRSAMAAPDLRRSEVQTRGPQDPKFLVGDAFLAFPTIEERDAVATLVGLNQAQARSYAKVAEAWPVQTRVATSWTVHRELCKKTKFYDPVNRFDTIRPGMTMREAHMITNAAPLDRKAPKHKTNDELADEIVQWLLDARGRSEVVPLVEQRLEASVEGRRLVGARRTTSMLRKLREEIRKLQQVIKTERERGTGPQRFRAVKLRILETECHVNEADLLWQHDRFVIADDDWVDLGKRIEQLGDRASQVAAMILGPSDAVETDSWEDPDWKPPLELSAGEEEILDAEIVDEG